MKSFARFVVNNKLWIVIIFTVLLIASIVGMTFVKVNYNDSAYLPDDNLVSEGLKAMYGEFGEGGNATVMLSDTDVESAVEFKQKMAKEQQKIENIKKSLERSPERDMLDLSGEEQGFFELNGKVVPTFFPR